MKSGFASYTTASLALLDACVRGLRRLWPLKSSAWPSRSWRSGRRDEAAWNFTLRGLKVARSSGDDRIRLAIATGAR